MLIVAIFSFESGERLELNSERLYRSPGGWTPHMEGVGILVVSLRGVNFRFWSYLGCSRQNAIIFSPPDRSLEKEEGSHCLVFTSYTKCEIRHFHVVVVQ